jgi:electron transport complex protein RnfG
MKNVKRKAVMADTIGKHSLRTAAILLGFTLLGTAILAYTFSVTKKIINHNEELAKLALITQTLPKNLYDNDIIRDHVILKPQKLLGTDEDTIAYRARKQGHPVAVVLEAIAPDGYGGKISMLVAILANGEIAGVRVISHNETPGLGDYIDIAKSPWIKIFDGTSLAKLAPKDWKVKKDGGKFDHMAGATVTPRAVVKAVHKALEFYSEQGMQLFSLPTAKQEQKS